MDWICIALAWFVLCAAVMPLAKSRGRNWFGWFIVAVVLSPVLAVILLLCCENRTATRRHQELLQAVSRAGVPRQPTRGPRNMRTGNGPNKPPRGPKAS